MNDNMKRTLILLGSLLGVILIIGVANYTSANREKPALFKDFDKAAVTRIILTKYGSAETLKRDNNTWSATQNGDYPADTGKVAQMLTLLADQKKGDPVSKNPAKHAELRVDTVSATKVVVEAGKRRFVFFIGNMAQGFSGNYLRFDGKNEVYVTKGGFESAFSTAPDFYRSKAFLRLAKEDISEFSVVSRDPADTSKTIEVSAKFDVTKGAWKLEKPVPMDADMPKVVEYLGKFCALEVDEWYDKDTTTALGFDNPELRAVIKKNDGNSVTLIVGRERNDSRFVKIEGDPVKYLLRKFRTDGLKPDFGSLMAKPAESAPPQGAAGTDGSPATPPAGNMFGQ